MGDTILEMAFPLAGLDEAGQLGRQRPGTTPRAQNVRPIDPGSGRARGGQRPGQKKYLASALGSASIQELTHITLDAGQLLQPLSSGAAYLPVPGSSQAYYLIAADGTVYQHTSADWNGPATFDQDGNVYITFGEATSPYNRYLVVRKYDASAQLVWETTLDTSAGNPKLPTGIVLDGGILYVAAIVGTTGSNYYLYRLDAQSGSAYGTNPWLNATLSASVANPGVNIHSALALGSTYFGMVGWNSSTTNLELKIIAKATGTVAATATITTGTRGSSDICADGSDNFYLTYGSAGLTLDRLRSYDSAASVRWTLTGSTKVFSCCYDRRASLLLTCGVALNGGANSVAIVTAASGAIASSANVGSQSEWRCVRQDGRGYYRVLYADRGASFNASFTESWDKTFTGVTGSGMAVAVGEQTSFAGQMSSRVTWQLGIAGGTVACFDRQGVVAVTNGSSALSAIRPVIHSAVNGSKIFFADGTSTKYWNAPTNTVSTWTPTAGSLPVDNAGNRPRLICTWRGGIMQAGLAGDPQNWFLSRRGDPLDWDYEPDFPDEAQACAGNNTPAGLCPDIINSLVPFSDNLFVFGGDHTLWWLTGDPMVQGSQMQLLSDITGMAWGLPWCLDPLGVLWFFGSRGGVFKLEPGGKPERISGPIDERLASVPLASTVVRLAWDDRRQGLHLFLTPIVATDDGEHYWFDARANGPWLDVFGDSNMNPKAIDVFDADDPDDRVLLLGGQDGYVRQFDPAAGDDDGEPIDSFVFLGPIALKGGAGFLVKDLQGTIATGSDDVDWQLHVGNSPQAALAADTAQAGVWSAGRNRSVAIRRFGQAAYLEIGRNEEGTWALEQIFAVLHPAGRARQRRF